MAGSIGAPDLPLNAQLPTAAQLQSEAQSKASATVGSGISSINGISVKNLSTMTVTAPATLKVQLSSSPSYGTIGDTIIFDNMPTLTENRSASYKGFTPIQHPGEILKYEGSSSRTWSINVVLTSRSTTEAAKNLRIVQLIRSWVMPFYGQGTANDPSTAKYLGAPPPILTLTAYGSKIVSPAKCVLESYSWDWPNTVDYINAATGDTSDNAELIPFPVAITVSLSLRETWSPAEYSAFNLSQYRMGDLDAAFGGASFSSFTAKPIPVTSANPSSIDTSQASITSNSNNTSGPSSSTPIDTSQPVTINPSPIPPRTGSI